MLATEPPPPPSNLMAEPHEVTFRWCCPLVLPLKLFKAAATAAAADTDEFGDEVETMEAATEVRSFGGEVVTCQLSSKAELRARLDAITICQSATTGTNLDDLRNYISFCRWRRISLRVSLLSKFVPSSISLSLLTSVVRLAQNWYH